MDQIKTPANIVTLTRICLVPVFVVALLSPWPSWLGIDDLVTHDVKSVIAAVVFIVISCSDWIDGYLARKRNEVTDFGKFVDPLADKILVCAALLALIELQVLPSWPVLIIISREFIVSGVRMIAATKGEVIAASWYGKAKTVTQIIAIVLFLLKDILYLSPDQNTIWSPFYLLAWVVMLIALVLTIISMLDYIAKARFLFIGSASKHAEERNTLSLAQGIIERAQALGVTIACAESLTGGGICEALTAIPGSSCVVRGGVVSYVNEIKHDILGVDEELLETNGAVNAETAQQMAQGVRDNFNTTLAVSATGIAGPTGAEPDKPIGTVFLGIASSTGCNAHRFSFAGDRSCVREQSVLAALSLLDEALLAIADSSR